MSEQENGRVGEGKSPRREVRNEKAENNTLLCEGDYREGAPEGFEGEDRIRFGVSRIRRQVDADPIVRDTAPGRR